ncbi:DUF6281 family protein [Streptomyces sp. NPDC057236]|uniref:DUF6281 family protein n=1 Tax=Streptomyces sp. NPDC057236 TaxID=3346059 RepID=UPI0036346125
MRWSERTGNLLLGAAVLMSAAACTSGGGSDGGGEQAASCAYRVLYQDRMYRDVADVRFTVGEELGSATLPPCDDTGGRDGAGRAGETMTAYGVDGISPEVAVAVGDSPGDSTFVVAHPDGELPPEVRKLTDGS